MGVSKAHIFILASAAGGWLTGCAQETRDDVFGSGSASQGSQTSSDSASAGESAGDTDGGGDFGTSGGEADESSGGGAGPLLDVGAPDPDDPGVTGDGCKFIDVLFVVDISASMHEEQANLDANFPGFVQVLDDYVANNDAMGYRVGVTNSSINADYDGCTTTMGFDGALTASGGGFGQDDCGTMGTPWLDGPDPSIAANFSCLAQNPIPPGGGSDCGKERPLGVIERFIEKAAPGGVNDGFYRGDDSLLVIVNLTDEDEDQQYTDTTPAQTKAALDAFAAGEERYVVVNIAGPEACSSAFGQAIEATVLKEFTDLVPNGMFGDICQGDLSQPLADALELIQMSCDFLPPPQG